MADETKPVEPSAPRPLPDTPPSRPRREPRPRRCRILRARRRRPRPSGGRRRNEAAAPRRETRGCRGRGTRSRRHVAAAQSPAVARPRLGRVLSGVRRGARRDRPLHVPERAQRAAAAVQGRTARPSTAWASTSAGRTSSASGSSRRRRRHRARQRLLRAHHRVHAPGLHAELARGGKQVQVPLPRQRLSLSGVNFEGPTPRPLERARIVLADDGQILDRQEPPVPGGAGAVDRSGSVSEGVGADQPDRSCLCVGRQVCRWGSRSWCAS